MECTVPRLVLLFALLPVLQCVPYREDVGAAPRMHILFVGNSLTYYNGLPLTVAAIAATAGDTFDVAMSAGANLGLIDHLAGASDATQQLAGARWDFVVLQQGPTPSGICRDSLMLWTRMFDGRIRGAGARTAVFMTWPGVTHADLWDDVRLSFQLAAKEVDGVFLPGGEALRFALAARPGLPLFGPDGFHPSEMGSFLAALEIYERLSGRDVRTLARQAFSSGRLTPMSPDTVAWLQDAAHRANEKYGPKPAVHDQRPVAESPHSC